MDKEYRIQHIELTEKPSKQEEFKSPYKPSNKKHRKMKRKLKKKELKTKNSPKQNDEETKRKLVQLSRGVIFEENDESSRAIPNTHEISIKDESISNYLSLLQSSKDEHKIHLQMMERPGIQLVTPERKSDYSDEFDIVTSKHRNKRKIVNNKLNDNESSPTLIVNGFPMLNFEGNEGLNDFKSHRLIPLKYANNEEFKQSWEESPMTHKASVLNKLALKYKKMSEVVYDNE